MHPRLQSRIREQESCSLRISVIFQRHFWFAECHRMWQQSAETTVLCSDTLSARISGLVPCSRLSQFSARNHLLVGEVKQPWQHLPTSGPLQLHHLWVTVFFFVPFHVWSKGNASRFLLFWNNQIDENISTNQTQMLRFPQLSFARLSSRKGTNRPKCAKMFSATNQMIPPSEQLYHVM